MVYFSFTARMEKLKVKWFSLYCPLMFLRRFNVILRQQKWLYITKRYFILINLFTSSLRYNTRINK